MIGTAARRGERTPGLVLVVEDMGASLSQLQNGTYEVHVHGPRGCTWSDLPGTLADTAMYLERPTAMYLSPNKNASSLPGLLEL